MECVCGCGRELPKKLAERNYLAAGVAIELLAWDKNRLMPGPGPDGREGLIARGVECYEQLLYSLHGEGGVDPDEECTAWVKESAAMRAGHSGMSKKRLLGASTPNLSEDDMARLDRRHPERSFTGGGAAAGEGTAGATAAPAGPVVRSSRSAAEPVATATDRVPATTDSDADLVTQLERLRSLRDDGALTDEEFAAAKARLLDRD